MPLDLTLADRISNAYRNRTRLVQQKEELELVLSEIASGSQSYIDIRAGQGQVSNLQHPAVESVLQNRLTNTLSKIQEIDDRFDALTVSGSL